MYYFYWVAFSIYFAILFAVGMSVRKKNATSADMVLGGRKLNFWVTALSAQAGDMSSWLFMSIPMSLYIGGVPQLWLSISLIIGMFCCWHFVAPRFREQTEYFNCNTMPSYLAKRFDDTRGSIRIVSTIACVFFLTYYVAAGLISIGLVLDSLFGLDYTLSTFVAAAAMVGYIFIGGFVSVAWVDLFQAIFLLLTIIIVPVTAFTKIDGLSAITAKAQEANISLQLIGENTTFKDIFYTLFAWGFGYFGMPHIITKFMGIDNAKNLVKSKYVGLVWQILALAAASSVGLIGIAYFSIELVNPELIFITLVKELFHPLAGGFALCGLLAATVSTMDSQLLVASSVVSEDIFKQFKKSWNEKQAVIAFRLAAGSIAALAFFIALSRSSTIMDTVYFAWSGLGTSFAPVILGSLYAKKITHKGAFWSICTGCLFSMTWPTINSFLYTHHILEPIPSMIIGFPLGLCTLFLISAIDQKK